MTPTKRDQMMWEAIVQSLSDYDALKAYGHTPAKAAEIALDAKRGDHWALCWVKTIRASLEQSA